MTFLTTALALLGLLTLWGAGLAVWVLPRRWRAHWPVLAPAAGIAAVSAVGWIAVHAGAAGTDAYAAASWLVPLGLLGAAATPVLRVATGSYLGLLAGTLWFGAALTIFITLGAVIASRLYQLLGDSLNRAASAV